MTALSVVMPVYNEAEVIERLVLELEQVIVSGLPDVELIVVDDRSTDDTGAILDRLAQGRSWLAVEHASENAGHGPSVLRGLRQARGDWIFQLDSDCQFRVADLWKLWALRTEADLVLGVRASRQDPTHRLVLSRIVALTVSALARRRLRDANVPFRLIRRELWDDLDPLIGHAALAPSILVSIGAVARAWRLVETPVTHLPRAGSSSLRAVRLVSFSLRGLLELIGFHRQLRRQPKRVPLVAREVT
jgi:dolichol-phosphate mannosyltransferase